MAVDLGDGRAVVDFAQMSVPGATLRVESVFVLTPRFFCFVALALPARYSGGSVRSVSSVPRSEWRARG